jgi:outer membrane autotransporter protein
MALLASAALVLVAPAQAQDATWAGPGNSWNVGGNWSSGTVPTGTATFSGSTPTSIAFFSSASIDTMLFTAGAPLYSFNIGAAHSLVIGGAGIVNNSSNAPTFLMSPILSELLFINGSTAGNAILTNSGIQALTIFANSSTAGNATITNTNLGSTTFNGTSTAGNASITSANGGFLSFLDASTAGNATITTNGGGSTSFNINSNAGSAQIVDNGTTSFNQASSAGNATIINNSVLTFNDTSSSGDATITTNSGGTTSFAGTASGGLARFITNAGGTFDISGLSSNGTSAGSIEGGGSYVLGSKQLTVGGNGLSTEVSGTISGGGGSLVKVGAGALTLNADDNYTGGTTVAAGTLIVGDIAHSGAALSGGGGVMVMPGATLGGYGSVSGAVTNDGTTAAGNAVSQFAGGPVGNFTINGSLLNGGVVNLAGSTVGNQLIVVGNYVGAGGVFQINTVLGSDGSPSDKLVISGGNGSGSTAIRVNNVGGGGALITGNGILVVNTTNGGTTQPGAFALARPVAGGPYDYMLFRGSVDASNVQAWYLRSTLDCKLDPANPACNQPNPGPGPGPSPPDFRPETSLYAAIPSMALLYGRTLLDTLHERVGEEEDLRNRQRLNGVASGAWGRVIGQHGDHEGDPFGVFGSGPKFNYDIGAFQGGQDLLRRDSADGSRDHAGLYAAVGLLKGDVTHFDRTFAGTNTLNAYSLGGYWTHFGAPGWYLDAVLQSTWYDTKGVSNSLPALATNGWGFAGSLDAGYPIKLGGGFIVEPQAQIVYQNASLGDGNDTAATVQFRNIESVAARIGARFARTWSPDDSPQPRSITAWIRPSLWNEFRGAPQTLFSSETGPVPFQSDIGGSWFELNAGMDAQITRATSLFANVGYQVSTNGNTTAYNGKAGLRVAW